MRNIFLAIAFAFMALQAAPAMADNSSLFQQIQEDTAELQALLQIVSDDTVTISGYEFTLPAAIRTAMITRMLTLRTNIKNNLNSLTVE